MKISDIQITDTMSNFKLFFNEGAERLLYYRKGKEYDVPLDNGSFSIRLGVGEGVFAIPYKFIAE